MAKVGIHDDDKITRGELNCRGEKSVSVRGAGAKEMTLTLTLRTSMNICRSKSQLPLPLLQYYATRIRLLKLLGHLGGVVGTPIINNDNLKV